MDTVKLKTLLARHGLTQTELARLLGRDKSVVTHLLQGKRQLKAEEASVISRALGLPIAEVLGLEEAGAGGVAETVLIPFQHEPTRSRRARQVVSRGGKYFLEEGGSYSGKAFALEVPDDSLNLSGVLPGDIIISELDRACKPGALVIAQHYVRGGAKTVIRRYEPPFLMAHSTNPAYQPLHMEQEDVRLVAPILKLVRLL